jgi:hypothetical protein
VQPTQATLRYWDEDLETGILQHAIKPRAIVSCISSESLQRSVLPSPERTSAVPFGVGTQPIRQKEEADSLLLERLRLYERESR